MHESYNLSGGRYDHYPSFERVIYFRYAIFTGTRIGPIEGVQFRSVKVERIYGNDIFHGHERVPDVPLQKVQVDPFQLHMVINKYAVR